MMYPKSALLLTGFLVLMNAVYVQSYECRESRCGISEPPIRFPFRLVGEINDHCGYPGFLLSCDEFNNTILELPSIPGPLKLVVSDINYTTQEILIDKYYIEDGYCNIPAVFRNLNLSSFSPFQTVLSARETDNFTLFDCSSLGDGYLMWNSDSYTIGSYIQNSLSCPIFTSRSDDIVVDLDLPLCTKMFEFSPGPLISLIADSSYLCLNWSNPTCGKCEAKGEKCRLKNNTYQGEIECLSNRLKPLNRSNRKEKILESTILAPIGGTVGAILLGLMIFYIYRSFRMRGEDQTRVEKFLKDYRAFRPTRFSYADIKRITKRFKDKLGEGSHGQVFKGELSNEILVAVKILNNTVTEADEKEFINEVGTMGKIHHINVVRLLGYCADGFHRALVYEFFPNGSLQKFISPPDNDNFLGWEKLQQIALGIAKGVEYLHQGCDPQILHFDINPRNVLMDNGFIPKISDFSLAKLCQKNQSKVSMSTVRGTLSYIAPEIFLRNFGNVYYKSDIYNYGILLLEMVGGRKNMKITTEEIFQILYLEWIHNLLEERDIQIHIEDEGEIKIAKKLATIGLWCIQWHPVNRPSMETVIQMLEGDANKLRAPPHPFHSAASNTSDVIPARRLNFELEVIQEVE